MEQYLKYSLRFSHLYHVLACVLYGFFKSKIGKKCEIAATYLTLFYPDLMVQKIFAKSPTSYLNIKLCKFNCGLVGQIGVVKSSYKNLVFADKRKMKYGPG